MTNPTNHSPINFRRRLLFALTSLFAWLPSKGHAANETTRYVTYEEFGAVGDGLHDDLQAICEAHNYANENNLPVRSKPGATYHLGKRARTAWIATDTDWNTSRFTIDDRKVSDHTRSLFMVVSKLERTTLPIKSLKRDQKEIEGEFDTDYYVSVKNSRIKRYIRRGGNQNSGKDQKDCFILKKDGTIEGPIDWNYDEITDLQAKPIDENTLTITGGVFVTVANRMEQKVGTNYWRRNIRIIRSNTVIDGLAHYVVGETDIGQPYRGFLSARDCAYVTFRNCFASGHKVYHTIGRAGRPVPMGSYDYAANSVVNFSMINCSMHRIMDRTRWGVIATNYCKNILLEDCTLSRMDAHMGVSGTYTIRRTTLGYMGLNAIGRGKLILEDSKLHGDSLISFRQDYGATWEGTVEIRNCEWYPTPKYKGAELTIFDTQNDGNHDFGYTCYMPKQISIDGLTIDDSDFEGNPYFFSNPGFKSKGSSLYPYQLTEKIEFSGIKLASGRDLLISKKPELAKSVTLIENPRNLEP